MTTKKKIRNTVPKSISMPPKDWERIKAHATVNNMTVSQFIKQTIKEVLEETETKKAS